MGHNLKLTIEVGGRTILRILYADSSTDNWSPALSTIVPVTFTSPLDCCVPNTFAVFTLVAANDYVLAKSCQPK